MTTSDTSHRIGDVFFQGDYALKLEFTEKSVEYSLYYLGRSSDHFSVGYREFMDGSIREKFSENYFVHIESTESPFKFNIRGIEFEVVAVGNQELLLRRHQ